MKSSWQDKNPANSGTKVAQKLCCDAEAGDEMAIWKQPPIAKIYEALSAVADGRVRLLCNTKAEVTSSSGDKKYAVEWSADDKSVISNDNASHWQGYLGYPIIAVWMLRGKLQYDPQIAAFLIGIPWKRLNKQFHNKYDEAIESVLKDLESRNVKRDVIVDEVERIRQQVSELRLEKFKRYMPK